MATIFKNWDELGEALAFDEKGKGKVKETEKVVVEAPEKDDDEEFVKKNAAKEKIKKLIRGASEMLDDDEADADDILDELEGKLGDDDEEEEVEVEKPGRWMKRGLDLDRQGPKGGQPKGFVVNTVTTIVKPKRGFKDEEGDGKPRLSTVEKVAKAVGKVIPPRHWDNSERFFDDSGKFIADDRVEDTSEIAELEAELRGRGKDKK